MITRYRKNKYLISSNGLKKLSFSLSLSKIISKSNMLLLKKISEKYLLDKERIIIFQFE